MGSWSDGLHGIRVDLLLDRYVVVLTRTCIRKLVVVVVVVVGKRSCRQWRAAGRDVDDTERRGAGLS
jgi:hypothetical protein